MTRNEVEPVVANETPESTIVESMRLRFRAAEDASSEWREEARELFDLEAGRQWSDWDMDARGKNDRAALSFNLMSKYIDAVTGLQIANRMDIRYQPRELGDVKINEIMTSTADWARGRCQAYLHETAAWRDMLICGEGAVEQYIDYDDDPEGKLCIQRRDPLEVYSDPYSRMPNKIDARYRIRVCQKSPEEVKERWPDLDLGAIGPSLVPAAVDDWAGGPYINAMGDGYHHNLTGAASLKPVMVYDYQWWERQPMVRLMTDMGNRDVTRAQWAKLMPIMQAARIPVKALPFKGKTYYRAFIVGEQIAQQGEAPYQEGFTIACMTGKRDRNRNTYFALGRLLKEPQQFLNKVLSEAVDIQARQAKGGLMAEEGAFADPKRAEAEWAQDDSIIWMEPGAIQQGKVQPKPQSPIPAGYDKFLSFAMQALPEVSGLNLEIMGMTNKVQSGVLESQRKQSAITMVQWAFDALKSYYEYSGRQTIVYARDFLADGRLVRITGNEGDEQYIQLMKDDLTLDFDMIIDQSPTSSNMKERTFAIMMELLPIMQGAGLPIPPEFWTHSPLPSDLAKALADMGRPNPEEAQKQAQLQEAMVQAELQLKQATAEEKRAKAQEAAGSTQIEQAKMAMEQQKLQMEQARTRLDAMRLSMETQEGQAKAAMTGVEVQAKRAEVEERVAKAELTRAQIEAQQIENAYAAKGRPMPNHDPELKAKADKRITRMLGDYDGPSEDEEDDD